MKVCVSFELNIRRKKSKRKFTLQEKAQYATIVGFYVFSIFDIINLIFK